LDNSARWSRFVAAQCDLLHSVSLHQKIIATVGDELAKWDRQSISYDEFGASLNGLAGLVTEYSAMLKRAIVQQVSQASDQPNRRLAFSNAVCGLAVVIMAIDQATELGDPRDKNCAALATFGAGLTSVNVNFLCDVCKFETY